MKKIIVTGLAIIGICSPINSQLILGLDTPNDDPSYALRERADSGELIALRAEYNDILQTRIWPLKYSDVTNIFGPKLAQKPVNYALPMFVPVMQGMSGLAPKDSKRHMDYYAIGGAGYLQVYYNWDGETIGIAAFYLRTDDKFVPLHSTNDISRRLDWDGTGYVLLRTETEHSDFVRRMKWDKAGFASLKKWLDQHLPKLTDLGVVKVSSDAPSRVTLGKGKTCLITTRILTQPEMTSDWFSMDLSLESTNDTERGQSWIHTSVSRPGESIGFKMAGHFYRLTPKLKKP